VRAAVRGTVLLLASAALAGCAGIGALSPARVLPPAAPDDGRLHADVEAQVRYGPVSGYLQTPRGGAPGSTSPRRPTLEEIGVGEAFEPGVLARLAFKRHRGRLEWNQLRLHGDATLSETLVSQANTFPAGTAVSSDTDLMGLAASYGYLFELPVGGERVALVPGVGVRGVRFNYQMTASNGLSTDRLYASYAPDVGLDWEWRPRGRGTLRFSGHVSQTVEAFLEARRRMSVFDASARVHADLSRRLSLFAETGYRHVLLDDVQPDEQNRVHVDFGPWIGFGLQGRF
jgi:hypothetical protein